MCHLRAQYRAKSCHKPNSRNQGVSASSGSLAPELWAMQTGLVSGLRIVQQTSVFSHRTLFAFIQITDRPIRTTCK